MKLGDQAVADGGADQLESEAVDQTVLAIDRKFEARRRCLRRPTLVFEGKREPALPTGVVTGSGGNIILPPARFGGRFVELVDDFHKRRIAFDLAADGQRPGEQPERLL